MSWICHGQKSFRALAIALALSGAMGGESLAAEPRSYLTEIPEILERSPRRDWQRIRDEDLLYFELSSGTVIMELAPFATPQTTDQVRALARSGYYDNSAILRAQEDYVVQWGDPTDQRSLGGAPKIIAEERNFAVTDPGKLKLLDALDSYAPRTGFVDSFPVGTDETGQRAWIAHCHGVVGVVHDDPKTTAGGAFLYAVIGHRPRELDGKLAIGGRIIEGIEILSTLPRGEGIYGFYPKERYIPIRRARVAADVPASERRSFEKLSTGSETFARILAARRGNGKSRPAPIDVCSAPLPVREIRQ